MPLLYVPYINIFVSLLNYYSLSLYLLDLTSGWRLMVPMRTIWCMQTAILDAEKLEVLTVWSLYNHQLDKRTQSAPFRITLCPRSTWPKKRSWCELQDVAVSRVALEDATAPVPGLSGDTISAFFTAKVQKRTAKRDTRLEAMLKSLAIKAIDVKSRSVQFKNCILHKVRS